jgi:integrase
MKGSIIKRGGRWAVVLDVKDERGARKRKWHSGYKTKREAEAAAAKLITDMESGQYTEPSKLTVAEHLQNRMTQWEASGRTGPKTIERYREVVAGQINPHLGAKLIQKLRVADIEAWHNALRTAGYLANTIRAAHRILGAALKDAVKFGVVPTNVCSLQRPPKADAEEVQIIGEAQISGLLDKLQGRAIRTKVVIALFTGIRRGELCGLQWRDIYLDAKVLRIERALEQTRAGVAIKKPKTKAGTRTIALPDIVVDALREHRREQLKLRMKLGQGRLAEDAFIFCNPITGAPLRPQSLTWEWWELAPKIGFKGVRWHALRHSHASMLIASGLDVVQIAKRLGHSSPNVTLGVYAHMFRQTDDGAAAINAALAKLGRS